VLLEVMLNLEMCEPHALLVPCEEGVAPSARALRMHVRRFAAGVRVPSRESQSVEPQDARTQQLAEGLQRFFPAEGAAASKQQLNAINWRAALSVAFCALLCGAEFALRPTASSGCCSSRT
jgi:hypothetical protein